MPSYSLPRILRSALLRLTGKLAATLTAALLRRLATQAMPPARTPAMARHGTGASRGTIIDGEARRVDDGRADW